MPDKPETTTTTEPDWQDAWDQWWAMTRLRDPLDQIDLVQVAFRSGWQAALAGKNEAQHVLLPAAKLDLVCRAMAHLLRREWGRSYDAGQIDAADVSDDFLKAVTSILKK